MGKNMLFLLAGVLCLLYGTVVRGVHSGTRFFAVWYLLGGCFLVLAALGAFRVWERLPAAAVRGFWAAVAAVLILLAGTAAVILIGGAGEDRDCDTVIVLGAQVYESGPSVVLRYRLDAAAAYLEAHPAARCVVSGGQGWNEPRPEAEVMREYLIARGIPPERILPEPEATSTVENLTYSKAFCDCAHDRVGIVTNRFHMFRSVLLAKKLGYADVIRIPAGSVPQYLPNNVLRECLAVWKDLLCGNLL